MQWLTVGLIVAVVVGGTLGFFMGGTVTRNQVPSLASNPSLKADYTLYRSVLSKFDLIGRGYQSLPNPIDTVITGKLLYEDKRIQNGNNTLIVREYYDDPSVTGTYPVVVIFDTNSDGLFSLSEGYLIHGDPLYTGITPLQVVASGITGGVNASKKDQ